MSYRLGFFLAQAAAVAVLLGWFWLMLQVIPASPQSPDAASGHVILYRNHGATLYLTSGISHLQNGLPLLVLVIALAGEYCRRRARFDFRSRDLQSLPAKEKAA